MKVLKKDGSYEALDLSKIEENHLGWATKDLKNVSVSEIMMHAKLRFFDGIKTSYIRDVLIDTCDSLSSLEKPNYDTVAARLLVEKIYKKSFGGITPISLKEYIDKYKSKYFDVYEWYTDEEISIFNDILIHKNDFNFTFGGLQAEILQYGKYIDGEYFETPQMAYILSAMDAYKDFDKKWKIDRQFTIDMISEMYLALSNFEITLPTPERVSLSTGETNYASCSTIKYGDFRESWIEADEALTLLTMEGAGVGVDISDVASVGDIVKNGKIIHGGRLPMYRSIDALINKAVQQRRRGSASVNINFYDPEIIKTFEIASPKTPAQDRINNLSYIIKMHQLVYDRANANEYISLFSVRDCPCLNKLLYGKNPTEFIEKYKECENRGLAKDVIDARYLFEMFGIERTESSAHYLINIDEVNSNTPYKEEISQANICIEFLDPSRPLDKNKPNDPAIGICVLGNINQSAVKDDNHLRKLVRLLVTTQTHLALNQKFAKTQATEFVKQYRDIGIGVSNHAHWLAKNYWMYGTKAALKAHSEFMEKYAYYAIEASCDNVIIFGKAPMFNETTWETTMPHERANREAMKLIDNQITMDWDSLKAKVIINGMANCGLMMNPPAASSALPSNQTPGLEPIKGKLVITDKNNSLSKKYAPGHQDLTYDTAYGREGMHSDYIKHVAVTQIWMDKGISASVPYAPKFYGDKLPNKVLIGDFFLAKKLGVKGLYYQETEVKDDNGGAIIETEKESCAGGGCSL